MRVNTAAILALVLTITSATNATPMPVRVTSDLAHHRHLAEHKTTHHHPPTVHHEDASHEGDLDHPVRELI
jgi:hypothetical protein